MNETLCGKVRWKSLGGIKTGQPRYTLAAVATSCVPSKASGLPSVLLVLLKLLGSTPAAVTRWG